MILDVDNEFSLYFLPHILKKEAKLKFDSSNIGFTTEPIAIAFSSDAQFIFLAQDNNLSVA